MPKYIDFDALGVGMCNPDVFENKGYAEGWNTLIKILHDAPAADVEPKRKPGRWVSKEGIYGVVYCSICDFELKIDNTPHCPNCGAKMDAEPPKETEDNEADMDL